METENRKRVLAISSGGGHFVQLRRLMPAFEGHELICVSVDRGYFKGLDCSRSYVVNDATRWNKLGLLALAVRVFLILIRERPHVIVTTGAAPGFFAIAFGRLFGSTTVWIDSIANAETLSLSGKKAGKFADHWLTQWEHLATKEGPSHEGAVL